MAALIKGIPVTLYERTKTGEDAFHEPVYAETPVTVENVLITPVDSAASPTELQLSGRHLVYELCIPKADTHKWEGCGVFREEMESPERRAAIHHPAHASGLG